MALVMSNWCQLNNNVHDNLIMWDSQKGLRSINMELKTFFAFSIVYAESKDPFTAVRVLVMLALS